MPGLKDLQSEVEAELIEVKTRLCAVGAQTLQQVSPTPVYQDYGYDNINFSGGEFALSTLFAVNKKYESYRAKDPMIARLKSLKRMIFLSSPMTYSSSKNDDNQKVKNTEYLSNVSLMHSMNKMIINKINKHLKYQVEKIKKDLQSDPYGYINITNSLAYNLLIEELGWNGGMGGSVWPGANKPSYKPFSITHSIMKDFADNYK